MSLCSCSAVNAVLGRLSSFSFFFFFSFLVRGPAASEVGTRDRGQGGEGRGSRENCGAELEDLAQRFWGNSRGRAAPPAHEPLDQSAGYWGRWVPLWESSGMPEGSQRKTGQPKLCMHLTPQFRTDPAVIGLNHRVQDGKIFGALSGPTRVGGQGPAVFRLGIKRGSTVES